MIISFVLSCYGDNYPVKWKNNGNFRSCNNSSRIWHDCNNNISNRKLAFAQRQHQAIPYIVDDVCF